MKELRDEATSDNACSTRDAAKEWACREPNTVSHRTWLYTTHKCLEIKTLVDKEQKNTNIIAQAEKQDVTLCSGFTNNLE